MWYKQIIICQVLNFYLGAKPINKGINAKICLQNLIWVLETSESGIENTSDWRSSMLNITNKFLMVSLIQKIKHF